MNIRGFSVDGFLLALLGAVGAAILFPRLGASDGPLHANLVATYGVAVVFFLYGLTLAPKKLRQGAANWRVHVVVQLTTFALFPLIAFTGAGLAGAAVPAAVVTGFLYLAALPSTVSSSVAMTSLARGNVPAAIFSATLSSLLGVFITPALMALHASTGGTAIPLLPVITKVILLVLLPIVLGQIASLWLSGWASRHMRWIKLADRAIILVIVFNALSNSMIQGIWTAYDPSLVVGMALGAALLFFVVYWLVKVIGSALGFSREDSIACLFCGSTKSLATGVPLAKLIFGASPELGLIIAPIMLYHFFQLVVISVLANRYARQTLPAAGSAQSGPMPDQA